MKKKRTRRKNPASSCWTPSYLHLREGARFTAHGYHGNAGQSGTDERVGKTLLDELLPVSLLPAGLAVVIVGLGHPHLAVGSAVSASETLAGLELAGGAAPQSAGNEVSERRAKLSVDDAVEDEVE